MRTLSLREPFATLIMNKKKYIETRSWKTNYRGELLIHASKALIGNSINGREELINLIDNDEMHYGKIICKCELVDCIEMTNEYIAKIMKEEHQQYICGLYAVGRYAWIIKNIEPLNPLIEEKGKLGLWNYNLDK